MPYRATLLVRWYWCLSSYELAEGLVGDAGAEEARETAREITRDGRRDRRGNGETLYVCTQG